MVSIPRCSELTKGSAGLGNPVVDFSVYVHYTRKSTTQVDEVFDCLEVIPSPLCMAPGMSFLVQPSWC